MTGRREHGNYAGYQQHARRGEDACGDCLRGAADYRQAYRRDRRTPPAGPRTRTPAGVIPGSPLTDREHAVLSLLADGRTRAEVAAVLYLDPATVSDHVRRARLRLGADTATHAVALAVHAGHITPITEQERRP